MKTWNFGILGPGKIARRFADAFQHVPNARVCAVASRDEKKAQQFAAAIHAEKCYGSYEEMVNDPGVDIVYISTPHPFHHGPALLCLRNHKAVLCEKPLAINLRQVKEMTDLARQNNTFLMEGMWSRFFPAIHKTLELIHAGTIGEVKFLQADFGFAAPVNPEGRVYNLALGGGAQLDVGVYPLFLAILLLGKPHKVKAFSHLTGTGADATTGALLYYKTGATADIFSSIVFDSPKEAHIMGTLGRIVLHAPWYKTQKMSLQLNSGEITEFPFPHSGNGFEFQIKEVVRCLEEKKTECELMPHTMSLLMAEVSDEIRRQGGIKYPEDD
jgi:predicted dehydrogenase